MVTEADFMAAHEELIPSVSAGELAHYEKVRATFEGVSDKQSGASGAPPGATNGSAHTLPQRNKISSSGHTVKSSKGKGKGKGKGKAVALTSDDEFDDSDHGSVIGPTNGNSKGKGKAVMGFLDGTASDDDGLY